MSAPVTGRQAMRKGYAACDLVGAASKKAGEAVGGLCAAVLGAVALVWFVAWSLPFAVRRGLRAWWWSFRGWKL